MRPRSGTARIDVDQATLVRSRSSLSGNIRMVSVEVARRPMPY